MTPVKRSATTRIVPAWVGRIASAAHAVVTLVVVATAAFSAHADPGVSLLRDPAPAGDDGVWVAAADARGHRTLRARFTLAYAHAPLVLVGSDQSTRKVVASQGSADLGLSYALFHTLLIYGDLPLSTADSDEVTTELGVSSPAPESSAALGDARLGARVRLLGPLERGLKLATAIEAWLPTGDEFHYNGDGRASARALLLGGAAFSRFRGSAELGIRLRPSERLPGILPTRVGRSLHFGISARAPIDSEGHFWIGPEFEADLGVGDGARLFDPRSTVAHASIALRVRPFLGALEFGASFGPGLGQGAGSADGRGSLFVGWSPEAPPPPPDADGDGIADASDICLNLPGQPSNDPLMNGCPEAPLDGDGDSIPDGFDACPRNPGVPTGARRTHGCPKGLQVKPTVPSPPSPPAVTVAEREIAISEQVQFETGTAVLRAESDAILGAVAAALLAHPEIELVEIAGHTDDTGTPEFNLRLSQERADAVLAWLVAHGVEPHRLRRVGFGQARPLAENTSDAGRAKNRRVEFRIIARRGQGDPG